MDLTSLPEEVEEIVRAQLEAGHLRSVNEVLCEALRLLHESWRTSSSRFSTVTDGS